MKGVIDRLRPETVTADEQPRVLDIGEDESEAVIDALSSSTRRAVLDALYDEPRTASGIADELGLSLQNAHYHLSALSEAGLVEDAGTRYSEKGNEMTVYAPTNDPIVFVGNHGLQTPVRHSLAELVGGVGLLGLAAVFVQRGAERLAGTDSGGVDIVGPAGVGGSSGIAGWPIFDLVQPGVLFFFGCLLLVVLAVVVSRRTSAV